MSNEVTIAPALHGGHGSGLKSEEASSLAQEKDDTESRDRGGIVQADNPIEPEAAVLPNIKLFILGTGMFVLWACNVSHASRLHQTGSLLMYRLELSSRPLSFCP